MRWHSMSLSWNVLYYSDQIYMYQDKWLLLLLLLDWPSERRECNIMSGAKLRYKYSGQVITAFLMFKMQAKILLISCSLKPHDDLLCH